MKDRNESGDKQRAKELKRVIRELKKSFHHAGVDRSTSNKYLKELQETLEAAAQLRMQYLSAKKHLMRAQRKIERLLDYYEDWTEAEIVKILNALVAELNLASHDCLLREDDTDFISSRDCLKRIAEEQNLSAAGMRIMLRSELENLHAIFREALEWDAPDFFAYAYYLLHEEKETLKEIENDRRNKLVTDYVNSGFLEKLFELCERAGIQEQVIQLMQEHS